MNRRDFTKTGVAAMTLAASGMPAGAGITKADYSSTGVQQIATPPAAEGFSFPAEWARHERTIMQFLPGQNWNRRQLEGGRKEWADVANAVAEFEPVLMAVAPEDRKLAEQMLSSEIELVEMPMNDGWSRDSGPMVLTNAKGERRVAGFTFNGWGAKFPPFDEDMLVKARFAKHMDMALHPVDMVLEGGAVAVDGEGTLVTTEECLLNANRNPGTSRQEIEAMLKGWLGAEKIIWIPKGLTPDPITDGHIDGMVAFAAPGVVLVHTSDDSNDPNKAITEEAVRILSETRDAQDRKLEVIEIPLTSWTVVHMNFYICNGGIIVPVAGKADEDDEPLGILREVFPDYEVVPITGRFIAEGGGGVHCITQQVPAV